VAGHGHCDIDVSRLAFIDASGMRLIAQEASTSTVCLLGARRIVRRSWETSGYAELAPAVKFLD
jgi:hypothetical protein